MSCRLGCCKGAWPRSVPTGSGGDKGSSWCHVTHLEERLRYKIHPMLPTAPAMETLKNIWTDLNLKSFYYSDTPSTEFITCLSQLWCWVERNHFFHPVLKSDHYRNFRLCRDAWRRVGGALGFFLEKHGWQILQMKLAEAEHTWLALKKSPSLARWNAFTTELAWC